MGLCILWAVGVGLGECVCFVLGMVCSDDY